MAAGGKNLSAPAGTYDIYFNIVGNECGLPNFESARSAPSRLRRSRWEPISIHKACWIESDNEAQLADFKRRKHTNMAVDKHGRDVFLADTSYALALAQENFKDIRFKFTSEV